MTAISREEVTNWGKELGPVDMFKVSTDLDSVAPIFDTSRAQEIVNFLRQFGFVRVTFDSVEQLNPIVDLADRKLRITAGGLSAACLLTYEDQLVAVRIPAMAPPDYVMKITRFYWQGIISKAELMQAIDERSIIVGNEYLRCKAE